MEAWKLLMGSDIGLFSLFTISGCIVMPILLFVYAKKKVAEDARNAK